jgi:hypothetical protein
MIDWCYKMWHLNMSSQQSNITMIYWQQMTSSKLGLVIDSMYIGTPIIWHMLQLHRSQGSSVSIVSDYGLGSRGSSLAGAKDFSSSPCIQTSSGTHPAPYPIGTGGLSLGVKHGWGVTLTTHPHLVLRSGMSRSSTSSPPKRLHGV